VVASRLENEGPTGIPATQTSNRAELRAVIAALQFREWHSMGERAMVIATDSEYVVKGVTEWVHTWARREWQTSNHQPVKNRDLWDILLAELRKLTKKGMDIQFWRIPRQYNTVADRAAKDAATEQELQNFVKLVGIMV
jgi:ribonuclease HI